MVGQRVKRIDARLLRLTSMSRYDIEAGPTNPLAGKIFFGNIRKVHKHLSQSSVQKPSSRQATSIPVDSFMTVEAVVMLGNIR